MRMKVEIHGYASIKADVRTVGDLRELVKWMDKFGVDGARQVEVDRDVWTVLADTNDGDTAEMIECGDHIPPNSRYDVLINTHSHSAMDYPANYEEALEDALPVDVPKFDWMSRDKYSNVWEGLPE